MLQWFNSSFGSSHNLQTSSTQLEKLKGVGKEGVLQLLKSQTKKSPAQRIDSKQHREQRKLTRDFCLVFIKKNLQK